MLRCWDFSRYLTRPDIIPPVIDSYGQKHLLDLLMWACGQPVVELFSTSEAKIGDPEIMFVKLAVSMLFCFTIVH